MKKENKSAQAKFGKKVAKLSIKQFGKCLKWLGRADRYVQKK